MKKKKETTTKRCLSNRCKKNTESLFSSDVNPSKSRASTGKTKREDMSTGESPSFCEPKSAL